MLEENLRGQISNGEKLRCSDGPASTSTTSISTTNENNTTMIDTEKTRPLNDNIGQIVWPRGWRPYAALLLSACCINRGLTTSYGVFQKFYLTHHLLHSTSHAADMAVGLIGGTQAGLCLSLSFIVGRLMDAGWHRWVIALGSLLVCLGYGGLGFWIHSDDIDGPNNYGSVLALQGIMAGVGMSCLYMFSSQSAASWFPHNRLFAIGFTGAGLAVGGLIYPPVTHILISRCGFAHGMRLLSLIIGLVSLLAVVFGGTKPDFEPRPIDSVFCIATWVDHNAFRNRCFLTYSVGMGFVYMALYPILFHLTEWAEEKKMETIHVVWCLAIANGCGMLGRITSAVSGLSSSRRVTPLHVLTLSCFICASSILTFWTFSHQESHVIAFCIILGVSSGVIFGLPEAGVAYMIPEEFKTSLGAWTGTMRAICSVFAVGGPLLCGLLVRQWGVIMVGYLSGGSLMVASILVGSVTWMVVYRSK